MLVKKLVFLFLVIVIATHVKASPIAVITPQENTSYDVLSITGNESCWGNIQLYGTRNKWVNITINPISRRGCWYCNDSNINGEGCRYLNATVPSTLAVTLRNHTRYVNLPQAGGQWSFRIPEQYLHWLRWIKFGDASYTVGDGVTFTGNFTRARSFAGLTDSYEVAYIGMNVSTSGIWANLTFYLPFDRSLCPTCGDAFGAPIVERDHSTQNKSISTAAYAPYAYGSTPPYFASPYGLAFGYNYSQGIAPPAYTQSLAMKDIGIVGGNYTVMFWVYNNETTTSALDRTIFKQGVNNAASLNLETIIIELRGTGHLSVSMGNGSTSRKALNLFDIDGLIGAHNKRWIHIAVSSNATGRINVYVNGLNATNSSGHLLNYSGTRYAHNFNYTTIGARTSSTMTNSFSGLIDEVMVFRMPLNQSQIQQIYRNETNRYNADGWYTVQGVNMSGNNSIRIVANVSQNHSSYVTAFVNGRGANFTTGSATTWFNTTTPYDRANISLYLKTGNATGGFNFMSPYIFYKIVVDSIDTDTPQWYNLSSTPLTITNYTPGHIIRFNITWYDESPLSSVVFVFDNENLSTTHQGNGIYTASYTDKLPGIYNYYSTAYDAQGNYNISLIAPYIVSLVPYPNFTGNLSIGFKNKKHNLINLWYANYTARIKIG